MLKDGSRFLGAVLPTPRLPRASPPGQPEMMEVAQQQKGSAEAAFSPIFSPPDVQAMATSQGDPGKMQKENRKIDRSVNYRCVQSEVSKTMKCYIRESCSKAQVHPNTTNLELTVLMGSLQ